MSTFPNRIESVPFVCSCFATHATNRLQVLQAEECERFSVFFTSLWIVLAPVVFKGFTGLLQHGVHPHLIHWGTSPAQRTAVGVCAVLLCVPAVFLNRRCKIYACKWGLLADWEYVHKLDRKGHVQNEHVWWPYSVPALGWKGSKPHPPVWHAGFILTSETSVNTSAPKGISHVIWCCVELADDQCTFSNKHPSK